MKKIICGAMLLISLTAGLGFGGELEDLFASVEALNIQRQGYTLCARLNPEQRSHAMGNMETADSGKVYRFKDRRLNIVADRKTHRVLVMFEQFDKMGQADVQSLVGKLFMSYGDPTVSAHDKVVYWAWGKKEKFTADQYKTAREQKKNLEIFATVKFNSEIKIMEASKTEKRGKAYYIISSDPLLHFFKEDSPFPPAF